MAEFACRDCMFFHTTDQPVRSGECRRYPPRIFSKQQIGLTGQGSIVQYPAVMNDAWCGEFEPIRKTPVAKKKGGDEPRSE